MRVFKFAYVSIFSFWWVLAPHPAFGDDSLFLAFKLKTMRSAREPEYDGGNVIFTYKAGRPVRFVGARFAHEHYKILHVYQRNEQHVFFLKYPVPENQDVLRYRIVVDGLWMPDPFNPLVQRSGVRDVGYSLYYIREHPAKPIRNPKMVDPTRICFTYVGIPGKRVTIVGDFNNWDPFSNPFVEDEDRSGNYSVCISAGPGRHYYNFIVSGTTMADPFSVEKAYDIDGRAVSYFEIPQY